MVVRMEGTGDGRRAEGMAAQCRLRGDRSRL